jgi:hypothetical protein
MITPITPFYPVLTKWTWHRVLADPMEREIIDFIVTSRLANRGLHPLAEGPLTSLDIIPSLLPSLPLQIVSELPVLIPVGGEGLGIFCLSHFWSGLLINHYIHFELK